MKPTQTNAEQINSMLTGLRNMIKYMCENDPQDNRADMETLKHAVDILLDTKRKMDSSQVDDLDLTEVKIQYTLDDMQDSLDYFSQAREHLSEALDLMTEHLDNSRGYLHRLRVFLDEKGETK